MHNQESIKKDGQTKNFQISIDFEDIDQLEFKSISKGLGLENNNARKPAPQFSTRPVVQVRSEIREPKISKQNWEIDLGTKIEDSKKFQPQPVKLPIAEKVKVQAQSEQEISIAATTPERISAYLMDIAIILLISSFTVFCFSFFSGLPISTLINLVGVRDFTLFSILIFSTLYLIYFSILESGATAGKAFFKLKLASDKPGKINDLKLGVIVARSSISMISFLLLGIPFLFLLQDKLTGSKVIKSK